MISEKCFPTKGKQKNGCLQSNQHRQLDFPLVAQSTEVFRSRQVRLKNRHLLPPDKVYDFQLPGTHELPNAFQSVTSDGTNHHLTD